MKKKTQKTIFILTSIMIAFISVIWAFLFMKNHDFEGTTIQIILFGLWGTSTLLITLYEHFFTKKKILSVYIILSIFIAGAIPLLNFVVMGFAYYHTFKNLIRLRDEPKKYGGFALSLFCLGLITLTLIKSIQGLYIYYTLLA